MALPGFRRRLCALLAVFALGAVAAPLAQAGTSTSGCAGCPSSVVEHPFKLAPLSYYLVPGGRTFENGAPRWQLNNGARVLDGNSTFYAHGAGEKKSLYLPSGSNAVSPSICVGLLDAVVRLYAQN